MYIRSEVQKIHKLGFLLTDSIGEIKDTNPLLFDLFFSQENQQDLSHISFPLLTQFFLIFFLFSDKISKGRIFYKFSTFPFSLLHVL